jgi:hypothetical protein
MFFSQSEVVLGNTIIKECDAVDALVESAIDNRLTSWVVVLLSIYVLRDTIIDGVKFIEIHLNEMDISRKVKGQYNIIKNQFIQKKKQYDLKLKNLIYDLNRVGLDIRVIIMLTLEYGADENIMHLLTNVRIAVRKKIIYNVFIDYDKGWAVEFVYEPGIQNIVEYECKYIKTRINSFSINSGSSSSLPDISGSARQFVKCYLNP